MALSHNRRRMSAILLLAIVLLNLVLISDHVQPSDAIIKKKLLKKLKKILPLLIAMKPKKKVIVLPLPLPIKLPHWPAEPWPIWPQPEIWPPMHGGGW